MHFSGADILTAFTVPTDLCCISYKKFGGKKINYICALPITEFQCAMCVSKATQTKLAFIVRNFTHIMQEGVCFHYSL